MAETHISPTNAGQQVTFCSITSLPNQQHTLVVEIGSNGVNNVGLDNFHIARDSITTSSTPPPHLPGISAINSAQSSQSPSHYVQTPTSPVSLANPAFQTPRDSVTPSPYPPAARGRRDHHVSYPLSGVCLLPQTTTCYESSE